MSTPQSLTGTLILALSQSEALRRRAQESIETIERLERENEKLKREVDELREARKEEPPHLSAQLDQLFRQDAAKQAEIDQLKSKLRLIQAKERKWRLQNPLVSSPIVCSDEVEATTPPSASRKRPRSKTPDAQGPLREVSGNAPRSRLPPRFNRLGDRGAGAIPAVAEDGEDYNRNQSDTTKANVPDEIKASTPSHRLQALLSAPAPATPALSRPIASSSVPRTAPSNAPDEGQTRQQPTAFTSPAKQRSPLCSPLPSLQAEPLAPEDEEPFRSRPVTRLNLSHFKLDPTYTGGYDHAYEKVAHGQETRKCLSGCSRPQCCADKSKTLAETLPPDDADMSEDDLLLELLGPGTEETIRTLTPVAKENLVCEARTKRLANLYGKLHRDVFDRQHSPPGYWDTDMPGTQEEQRNREEARLREREEVRRRYDDAMKGQGRWLFADE